MIRKRSLDKYEQEIFKYAGHGEIKMLNWKVATTYRDLHGLLEAALTTNILLIIVVIVIVVVVVVVVPRLLWLHAIPCLPYYSLPLPPPLLSFWLQTTNSCLALLQISIEDRSKTITKTWASTSTETKKSAKSDNQQLLFKKWSWKEKCPPVAKNCSTLSTSTKFESLQ